MSSSTQASPPPLIFGEVLFDHFPDGSRVLGGAPFNVAWHLQGLGLAPRFISRVGRDAEGDEVTAAMDRWGMDVSGLQRDRDHPTGAVQVTLDNHQPSYEILSQQAYDYIEPPADVARAGLVYHGSLAVRAPESAAALAEIRRTAAPVFIDVNLRAPWWDKKSVESLLSGAHWLKLNEDELALLHGTELDPLAGAEAMRGQYDLEWVILTRGAEGAVVISAGGAEQASARPSRLVDAVGAGDAFSAVMILGISRGWELPLVLKRATAFAADVCGIRGATTDDREFYLRAMERWD